MVTTVADMNKNFITPCLKLRLLLVGTYPPPYGGIASHLTTLIPGLRSWGAEDVAVISFTSENCIEQRDGFKVYRFNLRRQIWRLLNPLNWPVIFCTSYMLGRHGVSVKPLIIECIKTILINQVAKRHRSKVVSFYQCDMSMALLPLARLWRSKRSIVLSVFGEIYEKGIGEFITTHQQLFREIFSIPVAIVSSSCHCARAYAPIGITRPIEPVYYGVELANTTSANLRSNFRETHRIMPEDIVVLFMGRFTKEMGLDVLLKAATPLLERNRAVRLLIAGAKGDQSEPVMTLAAAYPDRVFVMQDVPFSQQAAIYSSADLLVAPSFNQRACMGMAIKEAMAAGLPVVGGAGGGVPEAIVHGETGFLVPLASDGAVDIEQFTDDVLRLVKETETRMRLGRNGRHRAEHLFSYEKTNQRMAEIFMLAMSAASE